MPIRILIVDDAVVVRKVLTTTLSQFPELEVIGTASNGRLALAKLQTIRPDIILLDIEMPEMNGLEAIPEIRKILPQVPIVMFSTLTERGAEATLDALSLGATDYVTKPSNTDMDSTSESIARELVPRIKALCRYLLTGQESAPAVARPIAPSERLPQRPRPAVKRGRLAIVAIGVSTGGPDALGVLLPSFPAQFPLPIVIVQHMPPIFTGLLAKRLSAKCSLPVRECKSGDVLGPSCIWLAPGDYHMVVREEGGHKILSTNQAPRENFCRPSVDVLFRSVAEIYGPNTLGVILTGMGQDGLKGCEVLAAAGASLIVQDEASSVVWGMPGFVARAGLAEKILPLNQIGEEIIRRTATQALLQPVH
jgi:two-component system chemotaxis response regulator CheB